MTKNKRSICTVHLNIAAAEKIKLSHDQIEHLSKEYEKLKPHQIHYWLPSLVLLHGPRGEIAYIKDCSTRGRNYETNFNQKFVCEYPDDSTVNDRRAFGDQAARTFQPYLTRDVEVAVPSTNGFKRITSGRYRERKIWEGRSKSPSIMRVRMANDLPRRQDIDPRVESFYRRRGAWIKAKYRLLIKTYKKERAAALKVQEELKAVGAQKPNIFGKSIWSRNLKRNPFNLSADTILQIARSRQA